ncbi:MAG: FMN-binding protein [Bacteroides sp.]|nr:FMN-binding protein [Eubacterium sp.]MCM1417224.1 FMN-binding protein [Roseburia sp.]MCM1461155.1 FMN-binding protein [Bacteroides sp.]
MMNYIKPVLVLSAITTIISALLIVTYNLTYVDTSGIITEAMNEKCIDLMGDGEFRIISDWEAEGYAIGKPDDVEKLIEKDDGSLAFEIIVSGYSKNGLDLLIAMNRDGSISGISVLKISETPGLGTNVNDPAFLGKFSLKKDEVTIVKRTPSTENEIDAVTNATYSSKGVANAVNTAIRTYREMGAIE